MASTRQIKQQNGDYDLTGAVEVFDSDAISSGPTLCEAVIEIGDGAKDLDGSGGTFELTLQIDGKPVQPSPQEVEFEAGETAVVVITAPFLVPSGKDVQIEIKSPNAADTDVDVTATLCDVSAIQPAAKGNTLDTTKLDAAVSSRAAEATLDGVKGAGWSSSSDTLEKIREAVANVPAQRQTQEL